MANRLHGSQPGFTLIEMLLVVGIIGILATIVAATTYGYLEKAKKQTAWTQMSTFKGAVSQFEMEVGRLPKNLQELVYEGDENWPGPFLDADVVPNDPWGNSYIMENTGKRIRIRSAGPDGQPGTDDDLWK